MAVDGVQITWLGHATWLFESEGVRVLVDPWVGNPRWPVGTDLGRIDVILASHGHVDHIASLPEVAAATGATVLAKYELALYLGGAGVANVVGFNTGGTVEAAGVRVTMTQAFHSGGITSAEGVIGYGGEPAGFVVEFANGRRVYPAGDTGVFGDMALIGEIYRPDLAVLPVGDVYTMGPLQAAHAVRLLGVGQVVCGHWGTFDALTGTPAQVRAEVEKLGLDGVIVHDLEPGAVLA